MTVEVDVALMILRVVIGLTLAAHGAQKLFGWFGGPGYERVSEGFGKRGLQPGWLWAGLAIIGEFGGGLSLALGLLTPLGVAGAVGAMVMAGQTHLKNGFFAQKHGYEYTLALLAASTAIGLAGAGRYSFDALFGIHLPEVGLFLVLAVIAIMVDIIGIVMTQQATHSSTAAAASVANRPTAS